MELSSPKLSAAQLISSVLYPLVYVGLIFALAGDWRWGAGWIFSVYFLSMYAAIMVYLCRKDPGLLLERFRMPGSANHKTWDRYLLLAMAMIFLAWFFVMPLDARRFGWTHHFPVWLQGVGILALAVSFFFLVRSFMDNHYLSPMVRIQRDRGHRVVSTGVYAIVRHPMYLGASLMMIGTPLLLGSVYGIGIGILIIIGIAARIIGEERMLVSELEGYADYRRKVRCRLLPYIW